MIKKGEKSVPSGNTPGTRLVLSEQSTHVGIGADWIGPLVVLGARAARYRQKIKGQRQIVIAISVPQRDFAAALIGCGWVLASEPPTLDTPLATLRNMKQGQQLRAVNRHEVIRGTFSWLDESVNPPKASFAGSTWRVDRILAIAKVALSETGIDVPSRLSRPQPGSIEHLANSHLTWDARLVSPAADLAIIGTLKYLEEDLKAYLSKENDSRTPSSIRTLLQPKGNKTPTWFTRLFPTSRLGEQTQLPNDINAAILDSNGAISYLGDLKVPVVVCIVDRSVPNSTSADNVVRFRNSWGKPLSLSKEFHWKPPTGVEALAFSTKL